MHVYGGKRLKCLVYQNYYYLITGGGYSPLSPETTFICLANCRLRLIYQHEEGVVTAMLREKK